MQSDYYLVAGIVIGGFAIASLVSAWTDGRVPRGGVLLVLVSGGLIALAIMSSPMGYRLNDVPGAFIRVVGEILN
ncbi:hypothetical protein [Actibacterium sp. MT2.3-13A]|uniref:hypothetical protein n=1 Tax=Actibacterium sp. MT2.3-13A TaxID=2828332 RepID=UPI001BAB7FFA|nr:hypothetical protein [Actibacterium sp. MT2.3-13A]